MMDHIVLHAQKRVAEVRIFIYHNSAQLLD